ncbi:TapY2 family type IVa secretion system protein [Shewanella sp.]|uniref:TapY2 family type IVa secretion system protein n=1 Tax=Shewanella sp. TaxID=50422 RepID=UPI00356A1BAF
MRINTLLLILLANVSLVASAQSMSDSRDDVHRLTTFKCFIDTNVGAGIYSYTWPAANTRQSMRNLAGTRVVNSAMAAVGVRVYAKKVFECVPEEGTFMSADARKLDEERPR